MIKKEKINKENTKTNNKIIEDKKDIENKDIPLKLMPFNSFFINSKSNKILNNEELEKENNPLNTSFTIKLTDNLKENILKMKNPKKKR